VRAIAIEFSGAEAGRITVPDLICVFGKIETVGFLFAGLVEEAHLDPRRVCGKQGKIHAPSVPRSAHPPRHAFLVSILSIGMIS